MNEHDLKCRTKQFALRCIKLADSLPRSPGSGIVASQLAACGTSVGANYRAACRGRSRAEFISKLGVAEEEADESAHWMELIMEGGIKSAHLVQPLHDEADALTRIVVSSIRTARRRSIQNPKSRIQNRR